MNTPVGLIGLGTMGRPMALTLRRAGFTVLGHDLEPQRHRALVEWIDIAADAAELCRRCGVVLLSLPGSPQVEALVHEVFLAGGQCRTGR